MESSAASAAPRPGRSSFFTSQWLRLALAIAAVEAVLIVFDAVPRWVAVAVALAVLVGYVAWRRRITSPAARQAAWAVAVSQALVLLVPLALWVASALVVLVLAAAALLVLVWLVLDR
jgi:hypothetical protein